MKVSTAIEKVYALGVKRKKIKAGYEFEEDVKKMLDEMAKITGHKDTKIVQAGIILMYESISTCANGSSAVEINQKLDDGEKNTIHKLISSNNMMLPENSHFRWGALTAEELCARMREDSNFAAEVVNTNIKIYGYNPKCYDIGDDA